MADARVGFAIETPCPLSGSRIWRSLTSTRSADNTGIHVRVLDRNPGGSWLRITSRPEVTAAVARHLSTAAEISCRRHHPAIPSTPPSRKITI